jgi:hypothetical protein
MIRSEALSRARVDFVKRIAQTLRPAVVAGCLAAFVAAPVTGAPGDAAGASAPLSGVLRADGAPLAGASLVVRGLTGAAASVVRVVKTDAEGTFCLADARPGVYSILAAVPGFRSATAQVLHRVTADALSFVRLDLDRDRAGVLPVGPGGALDPWAARAVAAGDVLRENGPVELAPAPAPAPGPGAAASSAKAAATMLPVRGSVASLQGFASEGGSALSQTSVDVRGSLGGGVQWGLSGEYDRVLSAAGQSLGAASRVALDVLPSDRQSIRVSTQRSDLPSLAGPEARFDAHSVDWAARAGSGSRASVSARILTHRNLERANLHTPLFGEDGSALEVNARYRGELGGGRFVRMHVGYRSDLVERSVGSAVRPGREARIGGVAGIRVLDAILVEAGGTGDYSVASRGLAPELTLSFDALAGLTLWGFASRRFEQRFPGVVAPGIVGVDSADLVRATRALYRAGTRLEHHAIGRLEVEASRREISEAFQLLVDSDAVDQVDALYLFPGDVADELSGSLAFVVEADVAARLSLQGGRVGGDGVTAGSLSNDARYWVASAHVDVLPSRTTVGVRYRLLEQELGGASEGYFVGRRTVGVTLAQEIPIPVLQVLGSRWQALFSLEMGSRRDGDEESRANRQLAGGLSLSF